MSNYTKNTFARASSPQKSKKAKNREEIEITGRKLKKQKKHRGLITGTRYKTQSLTNRTTLTEQRDPRIGSTKPISIEVVPDKAASLSLSEAELFQLENDIKLNELLDKLDKNEKVALNEQQYVDQLLEKIEKLMNELGVILDDE